MRRRFRDRAEAGRMLARELSAYANRSDVLVLALPRGGVPVAYEVAKVLDVPLDVFVVRKLGVPGQEELAMGAVASGNVRVLNEGVVRELGIGERTVDAIAAREYEEVQRREKAYRDGRPLPNLGGRTVILVDDGLATGATMRAAVKALRQMPVARIVAAVPVAAELTFEEMRAGEVDEIVCVTVEPALMAISASYGEFTQTTDAEVRRLLMDARRVH